MDDSREQRRFLHDLSNPLAIAQGNLRIVIDKLKKDAVLDEADPRLQRLEKALAACQQINVLLVDRRNIIKSRMDREEEPAA